MLQSKSPPAPSVLSCLRRKTICIIILEFKVRVFLQNYYLTAFWKNSLQSPKTWNMVSYVPINFAYDASYNFDYNKHDRINSFAKQNYNRKNVYYLFWFV